MPSILDKVLAKRPGNVVARWGASSRVPVLNPRDLARALEPLPLVSVKVTASSPLGGLLRAARDADAPLGFGLSWPWVRGEPLALVEAVRAVAEELRHQRPLFFEAGPLPIDRVARAQEQVFDLVDAGFCMISLEDGEELEAVGQAALERELPVEVGTPQIRTTLASQGEALWYADALELFERLGLQGAGSRAIRFLAEEADE